MCGIIGYIGRRPPAEKAIDEARTYAKSRSGSPEFGHRGDALRCAGLSVAFPLEHHRSRSTIESAVHRWSNDDCLQREVIGTGSKQPLECEAANGHLKSFRRAAYLKEDFPSGHTLTKDDFAFRKPNHGLDPRELDMAIGKKLRKDCRKLAALSGADDLIRSCPVNSSLTTE